MKDQSSIQVNKLVDHENMAYLIGLMLGRGTIYRANRKIAIEFPHANATIDGIAHCRKCKYLATKAKGGDALVCKNKSCGLEVPLSEKKSYDQISSTKQSILHNIGPFIQGDSKLSFNVAGNRSLSLLVLNFNEEPQLFESISSIFEGHNNYFTFELPDFVTSYDAQKRRELVNGLFDSAGFANAGSWMPRDGQNGHGRMRIYFQFVRNWKLVSQIDDFLRTTMDLPVQTIDWGHPNIRDSQLNDYLHTRETSWAREHQLKFFPEYYKNFQFRIKHKQELFLELLSHNESVGFSNDENWFPPSPINSYKPKHPGEDDARLPIEVRKHFDAFWQINLALGSKSLIAYSAGSDSPEFFALTGSTDKPNDLNAIKQDMESAALRAMHTILEKPRKSKHSQKSKDPKNASELESGTYPILVSILEGELTQKYKRRAFAYDTSSGNLSNFINQLDSDQIAELAFCENFDIRPDVVGFVEGLEALVFVESKITPLDLKNLGQLLGYCAVAVPDRAILVSTKPHSSTFIKALISRPEILEYAPGRVIEVASLENGRISYLELVD